MVGVSRTAYKKDGKDWVETCRITDPMEVYRALAMDMVHKKIHQCRYIKRITRMPHYDGTQTISVYYDGGVRADYLVEN